MSILLLFALAAAPVSSAERLAAARAGGWVVRGGRILNECDEVVTDLSIERQDLNGDGAPELIVSHGGGCYGGAGGRFAVLRGKGSAWVPVLSANGILTVLKTRHGGWADIEIGGPGMGKMPVARWTGARYSY